MRRKAKAGTFTWVTRGWLCAAVLSLPVGCGLDDKACTGLRTQAFDILNEPHTCNDDIDCVGSEWPGCTRPLSKRNRARIAPLKEQFVDGKCVEKPQDCRQPPEIYCKQGLCVFNEKSIR
ncbi:MAG TPA: hypothetical protein ENK23_05755 [Sorangium sp.]|nr:hypothetical protein [Sorangium sp.]